MNHIPPGEAPSPQPLGEQSSTTEPIVTDREAEENLDVQDAQSLINSGDFETLLVKIKSCSIVPRSSVASQLIEAGYNFAVAALLAKFEGLDASVAMHLIETGHGSAVARNLDKFEGLNHQDLAIQLIEAGKGSAVARNLDKFERLDASVAMHLIETGHGSAVVENLDKFEGLNYQDLAIQLIKTGYVNSVAYNLAKFEGLDASVAMQLIEAGHGSAVVENLDKFEGVNHQDLAMDLIEAGHGSTLVRNLAKFEGLNHQDLAIQLIEAGDGHVVAENLDKFDGLDASVAISLATYAESNTILVIQNLNKFIQAEAILLWMIDIISESKKVADAVLDNLSFVKLSPNDMYKVLYACSQNYFTAQKIKLLELTDLGLSEEMASELLNFIKDLSPELEDVKRTNPYKETAGSIEYVTITIPGQEVHFRASKISRLLTDETSIFRPLGDIIEVKVNELLGQVDFQEQINPTNTKEKFITSLFRSTYRRLAADFLALRLDELKLDYEELDYEEIQKLEDVLDAALSDANRNFLEVLETDTTYYDKLFNEWDAKRIGEKEFQEVFLGRDGIYAFIGRRAQIDARSRMVGLEGEREHEISYPTYLVYPRFFRDNLSEDVKSAYLSQRLKRPKSAHYFDTGFIGTIPQDIMQVMGVSEEDWNSRIRLLSARTRERTVIGLKGSEDERDHIVHEVEHNVKDENTAEALYVTQSGILEHIANPKTPSERLSFALVQMALHRHYYLTEIEKMQNEKDRFASTEIKSGELRIRQSLNPNQQEELKTFFDSDDVGKKLIEEARTIKVADPESPYPDEAVFELALERPDGVIVKSVVVDKQHGPLDEFEALLLLERLGIDAPKPLARLFTKEQHGFIVIDKLPGISGRTIKNYFLSEKIEDKDQESILRMLKEKMTKIAEIIRQNAGLDKPWRLKDFMIVFGTSNSGEITIERMLPIDFERAEIFDPSKPKSIRLGQELDKIIGK